jgi:PhzF family phenazine biosynthesis protein
MKLKQWHVDAFADRPFSGNPAAVVPLESWLPDATMQAIAGENNLSETAFFVPKGPGLSQLRWFTPTVEVELCGHATLASAWVLFEEIAPSLNVIRFETKSGVLTVERGEDGRHRMALPANTLEPYRPGNGAAADIAGEIGEILGVIPPDELHRGKHLVAVWKNPEIIRAISYGDLTLPLERARSWALIPTAGGPRAAPFDFISRFFPVGRGIAEDPVTGSAHCTLVPFWAKRLGKKTLRAFQASARGGELQCTDEGKDVIISGPCALFMRGEIEVENGRRS